jgi:hypothetical protein
MGKKEYGISWRKNNNIKLPKQYEIPEEQIKSEDFQRVMRMIEYINKGKYNK